jgi:DNA-binding NarL/FixJ family response regulator
MLKSGRPKRPLMRLRQVCKMIAEEGLSVKEIAFRTGLTLGTVKEYKSLIFKRLHVGCERELIVYYWRMKTQQPTVIII